MSCCDDLINAFARFNQRSPIPKVCPDGLCTKGGHFLESRHIAAHDADCLPAFEQELSDRTSHTTACADDEYHEQLAPN
jgi:hypothetical protein